MGEEKKEGNLVGLILFFIGAGVALWLLSQIFKSPTKKVEYYRCPGCRRMITPRTNPCPFCKTRLIWGSGNPEEKNVPLRGNSRFLVVKVISIIALGSFLMLAVSYLLGRETIIWSHILTTTVGYLAGHLQATVAPPP